MSTTPSLLAAARAQARRDLRLVWRRRGDAAQPLLFALMVVALFPMALGADPVQLARIAPGVLWVAVLLAGLLSLDSLYRGDLEDGSLEQMLLAPVPLAWLIFVRVLVHWVTTALPLVLLSPVLAELLYLPGELLPVLLVSLALGTPLLSANALRVHPPQTSASSRSPRAFVSGYRLGMRLCRLHGRSIRGHRRRLRPGRGRCIPSALT